MKTVMSIDRCPSKALQLRDRASHAEEVVAERAAETVAVEFPCDRDLSPAPAYKLSVIRKPLTTARHLRG